MQMDDQTTFAQVGIVTAIDTDNYRVKVWFPLLEKESDFIRVTSQYVGAGWGIVALPHVGQEVLVVFANGELNEGHVIGCSYGEGADAPPPSEEVAMVHESGSQFRFHANGDITLQATGVLTLKGTKVMIN